MPDALLPDGDGVSVRETELDVAVVTLNMGWQTALDRSPKVVVEDRLPLLPPTGVLSVPLALPKVTTHGFTIRAESPASSVERAATGPVGIPSRGGPARQPTRTRLSPPDDVIKLEDRLFYLLQPPLEWVLSQRNLALPFEPFPYQYSGVAFLYPRQQAILADEMGLGKTMQAIVAIRLLLHRLEVRRVLLVCPKPLVTNWQREFATWAPEIPVDVIAGSRQRRQFQWQQVDTPVCIANYEALLRDSEEVGAARLHFDLVILDESQRIKNQNGATSRVVRSISRRRSWALTGTPIENSADDLVGIFEFLSPGYLRSGMKPNAMRQAVAEHVLRRTKEEVLEDLPPRLFRDAEVELGPEQRATYDRAEEEGVVRLSGLGHELTVQHVFELILRLKQICNFDPATGESTKLERLLADLDECVQSDRKAIIFSQWVETLRQLKQHLAHLRPLEYHGRVSAKQRDGVIDQFRDDAQSRVLLMSYGAGSVGLNLQFASYVFLFDRWWNPAVEDQAIGRAHRIGSAGPVTVTRFLTLETIEQRIDQVLQEKRDLFESVFAGPTQHSSAGLTAAEIFSLFQLGRAA